MFVFMCMFMLMIMQVFKCICLRKCMCAYTHTGVRVCMHIRQCMNVFPYESKSKLDIKVAHTPSHSTIVSTVGVVILANRFRAANTLPSSSL